MRLNIFLEFIVLIPILFFRIFRHISKVKLLLNHNFGLEFAVKIIAEIGTNRDRFGSFLLLFICYKWMQMRHISLWLVHFRSVSTQPSIKYLCVSP